MEIKELVELLYMARDRFTTIHVVWQYRYDVDMMDTAQERWAAQYPPGSVMMLTSRSVNQPAKEGERIKILRVHRRVWWQKPACWREERLIDGRVSSGTILCDGKWWSFSLGSDTEVKHLSTNVESAEGWPRLNPRQPRGASPPELEDLTDGIPLLDPSFLLTSHALQPVGETVHAGREAVRVQATYRKNKNRLHEAFFWASADEYDLLVDKEYGILLRYAARLEGQEFAVSSVERVTFDEPIASENFTFTLP